MSLASKSNRPNLVFVFADQWRAQAAGYAGDPNLKGKTDHIDALASESVNFANAVSTCPVCTPYRGSLLTGQYPHTHGLFVNDVCLSNRATSIAEVFKQGGYKTAYIGKWHIDGHGRSNYIPKERRQGFDYWKVLECTHDYNNSPYYADNDRKARIWDGYDLTAQTKDACDLLHDYAKDTKPFCMFLSWGPPHNPFETAPKGFQDMFDPAALQQRPNVTQDLRKDLAGYYSHIAAMDAAVGSLRKTLEETGLAENTIFVLTSDHGEMLGSQNQVRKQRPWDEAIMVPLLLRWPQRLGRTGKKIDMPIGTPDLMPTLLGLCGLPIPASVEGDDFSEVISGRLSKDDNPVLIECISPFGEWERRNGGREYRGLRTRRYTYVRTLDGPWLLYDNHQDPYQMNNLANIPAHAKLQQKLDQELTAKLKSIGDSFLPGNYYIAKWGYKVDANGTVTYIN